MQEKIFFIGILFYCFTHKSQALEVQLKLQILLMLTSKVLFTLSFQPTTIRVLEYHVNWFEATGFTEQQVGDHLYALNRSCKQKLDFYKVLKLCLSKVYLQLTRL